MRRLLIIFLCVYSSANLSTAEDITNLKDFLLENKIILQAVFFKGIPIDKEGNKAIFVGIDFVEKQDKETEFCCCSWAMITEKEGKYSIAYVSKDTPLGNLEFKDFDNDGMNDVIMSEGATDEPYTQTYIYHSEIQDNKITLRLVHEESTQGSSGKAPELIDLNKDGILELKSYMDIGDPLDVFWNLESQLFDVFSWDGNNFVKSRDKKIINILKQNTIKGIKELEERKEGILNLKECNLNYEDFNEFVNEKMEQLSYYIMPAIEKYKEFLKKLEDPASRFK